jgi:hypothetical protein
MAVCPPMEMVEHSGDAVVEQEKVVLMLTV